MEEAAQVLESHIVASLTTSCQQLIMIGDHKQLRPACNVHQLATQYKMDRSLFERMIELGLPAVTLEVQYRKHPDIASLIVPSVYPRLLNDPSTEKYPSVPFMDGGNVLFFNHNNREEDDGYSFNNPAEANFVITLVTSLVERGEGVNTITILTAYAAQQRYIEKCRNASPNKFHVTTIDDYQGKPFSFIIYYLIASTKLYFFLNR